MNQYGQDHRGSACLWETEKRASKTVTLLVRRLQASKHQETSCSPLGPRCKTHMCGAARSCRLASNCTCASRTPDPILGSWGVLLQMSKNIKDKSFFEPVPLCLPMFMRAMFLQRSLVTPFVGNCLTNPGPDLTTLSSSVCGWSESLELLQTFRHRTLTSNVPWTSFQAKACASSGTQWCGAFLSLLSTDTIRGSLYTSNCGEKLYRHGDVIWLWFSAGAGQACLLFFSLPVRFSASGAMGPQSQTNSCAPRPIPTAPL